MEALVGTAIAVCGAGALGGNLAENLARMGAGRLTVVDFDDVEERNLSTQPYGRRDLGAPKARVLADDLYRDLGVDTLQIQPAKNDRESTLRFVDGVMPEFA